MKPISIDLTAPPAEIAAALLPALLELHIYQNPRRDKLVARFPDGNIYILRSVSLWRATIAAVATTADGNPATFRRSLTAQISDAMLKHVSQFPDLPEGVTSADIIGTWGTSAPPAGAPLPR